MAGSLYCSVAKYKTLTGLTGTASDSILTSILEMMSRLIDRYCGKIFVSNSLVELFDGNGRDTYYTLRRPVLSVTLLERDLTGDGSWEIISTDDYHAYSDHITLDNYTTEGLYSEDYSLFSRGQKNWRVTYEHGASETPSEIELACAMMTTYWLTDGASSKVLTSFSGFTSERIGNYSYSLGAGLEMHSFMPPEVRAILNLHRSLRIGGRGGEG